MSKLIDLTGQDFGYWHVIERAENDKQGQAQWLCKCTKCNETIKVVKGGHLRGGRSKQCPSCSVKNMIASTVKDEQGKTYGYLYVVRRATEEEKPRHDRDGIYWVCTCNNCGRKNVVVFGDYLRKGETKSCGCVNSMNESKIAQMFNNLNIKYIQQQRFKDLSSTGRPCDQLPFDFGIYNNNTLIYVLEYDGIQHFNQKHARSKEDFEKICSNDLMKNKYCFENNIPLIRIPYNASYDLNDLKLETTRFLLTPENEKEYYDSRK